MALTITAAAPADHIPPALAPRTATPAADVARQVVAQASTGSAAASPAQEVATLNRMLARYKFDQAHGAAADTLSGLGRQILAAAKVAGQRVTLPHAPAAAAAVPAAPTANNRAEAGKVNVTA